MKIERYGIVLNTEKYDECVCFYRELFELEVMFQLDDEESQLTCFEFGDSYLMIEGEGVAKDMPKTISECPSKLRFNVADIAEALAKLKSFGIEAEVNRYSWGATINLVDPDGNRIGIRDEAGFKDQFESEKECRNT